MFVVSFFIVFKSFDDAKKRLTYAKAQHKLKDFLGNDDVLFGVIGELGGFGEINRADRTNKSE